MPAIAARSPARRSRCTTASSRARRPHWIGSSWRASSLPNCRLASAQPSRRVLLNARQSARGPVIRRHVAESIAQIGVKPRPLLALCVFGGGATRDACCGSAIACQLRAGVRPASACHCRAASSTGSSAIDAAPADAASHSPPAQPRACLRIRLTFAGSSSRCRTSVDQRRLVAVKLPARFRHLGVGEGTAPARRADVDRRRWFRAAPFLFLRSDRLQRVGRVHVAHKAQQDVPGVRLRPSVRPEARGPWFTCCTFVRHRCRRSEPRPSAK